MNSTRIPNSVLSRVVWQTLLDEAAYRSKYSQAEFFRKVDSLEELRSQSPIDTGSIPASSAWLLYCAVLYFKPTRIVEIGTFIGKSTMSMALGADAARGPCEIHTCDSKNDFALPDLALTPIVHYRKTTSGGMLQSMCQEDPVRPVDFVNIDGHLRAEDFPPMRRLLSADAIIALDDFHGVAKGVSNLIKIKEGGLAPNHVLIYPCPADLLATQHLHDYSSVALLAPAQRVQFTTLADTPSVLSAPI